MRPDRVEGNQNIQIKVDVCEDDKTFTVHAEIPGVKKEDIDVSIDGSRVAISAEARYADDVLTLRLPKKRLSPKSRELPFSEP